MSKPPAGKPRKLERLTAPWSVDDIVSKTTMKARAVYVNLQKYPWLQSMDLGDVIHFLQLPVRDRKLAAEAREEHESKQTTVGETVVKPGKAGTKTKVVELHPEAQGAADGGFGMSLPACFGRGMGLRVEVEKLKEAAASARSEWSRLVQEGHRDAPRAFAVWTQILDAWTKLAKDAPKALQALDDSVPRAVHEAALAATLQAVDRILLGLAPKIAGAGQKLDSRKLEAICISEIEAARDALFSGKVFEENPPHEEEETDDDE